MLGALGAVAATAWKSPDLLKEIYGDLARPGVANVGKALATIVETGCLALLPLRLMNEQARSWEVKKYEQYAAKMANYSEDDIDSVRPEIGVTILEKLDSTSDPDLRSLFIDLLVSASLKDKSADCHPSFANVISLLSPDEAKIIKAWKGVKDIPFINIEKIDGGKTVELAKLIFDIPDNVSLLDNAEIYIGNLSRLGILSYSTDKWISEEDAYSEIISFIESKHPGILLHELNNFMAKQQYPESYLAYVKGVISIEPFGTLFQRACVD